MSIYCPQSIYCPLCGNHHAASQPCEVTLPTSDANDLDDVVRELGIEASDTTPTEAVRELKATIDRLRDELAKYEAAGKGLLPDCEPVFGAGVCAAFQFARAALGKVGAELANARLERDNIGSLNSSLIAELAEARRALLAGNDTVLANKKLQEDNAAKDRIIANLDARSAQYKRDSVAKDARVAKLEAYHTNCTDYINGLLGNMADDDKERVAILARAERAEAEALKAKAHIAALCDAMVYSDSYGVQGSEFQCCHACSAGGAPNVVFKHDEHCPVGKAEASAAEWWDDYKAAEEDRERAEAELAALRKNAPEWFAALRKIEAERDAMRKVLEAFCYAGRDELNDCASDLWAKARAFLAPSPAGREG